MKKLFQTLFFNNTNRLSLQLFRYAIITFLAYAIDATSLFIFTDFCGIHYLISSVLSSLCGGTVNYLMSISPKMFGRSNIQKRWVEFTLFTLIGAGGLVLNLLVMWIMTDCFGIYYMISKIFAIVIVFLWTFFVRRWMFTRDRKSAKTE